MTTATVDKEVSVDPSEEPAPKKIRLDDEPSPNIKDPNDSSIEDDTCAPLNKASPIQVKYQTVLIQYFDASRVAGCRKP